MSGPRRVEELLDDVWDEAWRGAREQVVRELQEILVGSVRDAWRERLRLGEPRAQGPIAPVPGSPLYLYGVVGLGAPEVHDVQRHLDTIVGVAGASLSMAGRVGSLAAVVSATSPFGLSEESPVEDPRVLEAYVRAHEQVLEHLMDLFPSVLPARFATAYANGEALDEYMQRQADVLEAKLGQLEGRAEWTIGLRAEHLVEALTAPAEGGSYLVSKSQERRQRQAFADGARRQAEHIHDTLAQMAAAVVVEPGRGDLVFRATYLVDKSATGAFIALAEELTNTAVANGTGLRGDLSGPWPPYTFASLEMAP